MTLINCWRCFCRRENMAGHLEVYDSSNSARCCASERGIFSVQAIPKK